MRLKLGTLASVILACGLQASLFGQDRPRFSGITPIANAPAVSLVTEDISAAPVLSRADAPSQEKLAARQLAAYLTQISDTEFKTTTLAAVLPQRAIIVGPMGTQRPPQLSPEGFSIKTEGQRLQIVGGTPHATLMGVFAFLEEQLGCRWWAWDAEFVPRNTKSQLLVIAQHTHIEPAFRRHNVYNREAQNSANQFAHKLRTVSLTNFTGGHNICPLLKPHAEKHPEFFPMDKNGERKFNNLHMNYAAKGIDVTLADVLKQQLANRKGQLGNTIFFAGMGDWYGGMDLSPESKQVYEAEQWTDPDGRKKPGYSATLLRMINSTAAMLEQEFPGIQVGTFAYMSLESPPAKTKPRDNVAIRLPRLRHDTVRSILESDKNQSFRRNLDRWAELAPGRLYIWEYGTNFNNFLYPFPCLRSLAENIKYYHKIGVAGISIQGNYVGTGGDLAALKNYVWAKLLWDPTRDVDELLHEFCNGYYGPAAKHIIEYVNLLEDSVRGDQPISADEFDKRLVYMTPELVGQAQAIFKRALAATGGDDNDPYYRRVKEAEVGLEAYLLWRPGPLKEDGERLVRGDLGGDTYPRALNLVKYCRNATPKEWGTGVKYRMGFLVMHGGPMPILKQGPVTVKVAPVQDGQIRSVLLNDVVAIDSSRVRLNPASVNYEMTKRDGNRVDMQADLGVTMWSGANGKQTGHRSVELDKDGVIHIDGSVERLGASFASNQAVYETSYVVKRQLQLLTVEYQADNGEWKSTTVSPDTPKADIPRANRLRITRRDRAVVIDDRYSSQAGTPTGTVEFHPKTGIVTLRVDMQTIQVAAEGPTSYGTREIRIKSLTR